MKMSDNHIRKKRNFVGWNSAEEVLRDFISRHWEPRFIIEGDSEQPYCSTVAFIPLDGYCLAIFHIVPPEYNKEFLKCFGDANEKMIEEIGFEVAPWLHSKFSERTIKSLNNSLAESIGRYEYETGYCVKDLFLEMLLYSEWNVGAKAVYEILHDNK